MIFVILAAFAVAEALSIWGLIRLAILQERHLYGNTTAALEMQATIKTLQMRIEVDEQTIKRHREHIEEIGQGAYVVNNAEAKRLQQLFVNVYDQLRARRDDARTYGFHELEAKLQALASDCLGYAGVQWPPKDGSIVKEPEPKDPGDVIDDPISIDMLIEAYQQLTATERLMHAKAIELASRAA